MDSNPYQFAYSFEQAAPMEVDGYATYTDSYDYSTDSPGVSSNGTGSSQNLLESQLATVSTSCSTLANALTLTPPALLVEADDTISISTVFHPDTFPTPDALFSSSDGLELNVILHHDLWHSPQSVIRPSHRYTTSCFLKHRYTLSISTPLLPITIYHRSAVSVSSHLLAYDLFSITDAMAERITPIYLKRLLLLHAGRFKSLKGILLHPPHPHPPTRHCGLNDQKKLTRAWALVSAYLVWDSQPDLSVHRIQSTLNPLIEHITCDMCNQVLSEKVKDVLVRWASVKCTI
ncbi:hypothetical protein CPB84DRAFT_1788327 [Gymnopilus junonius]|uniref:Uncharacterized protein n=1 Tax=Gymnopilus junonius TaxID=109634 RepID=A0A9P5NGX1_GYMJU|nr:hypothetical protein CPB84DRAFT_1788327 [Gymnopilus junonius]